MRAMVDILCCDCRKKFGFLYLGQKTHPCPKCRAINHLTEIEQALEQTLKAQAEHQLPDPFKKKP